MSTTMKLSFQEPGVFTDVRKHLDWIAEVTEGKYSLESDPHSEGETVEENISTDCFHLFCLPFLMLK